MAFLVVIFFAGCTTNKQWQYTSEQESASQAIINKSVAVPPFFDSRLNDNSDNLAMHMVPLMPFGWQELNIPEGFQGHITSSAWPWKPNEDIAKAVAEELNKSHLFKEVFFTNKASEGDIVLEGTIKSTTYDGKIISYGLSVLSPMLWLIGLPSGTFDNELILGFRLVDKKNNNKVLWHNEYNQSQSGIVWSYYKPSDFEYSEMLKNTLLQVIKDIRENDLH